MAFTPRMRTSQRSAHVRSSAGSREGVVGAATRHDSQGRGPVAHAWVFSMTHSYHHSHPLEAACERMEARKCSERTIARTAGVKHER